MVIKLYVDSLCGGVGGGRGLHVILMVDRQGVRQGKGQLYFQLTVGGRLIVLTGRFIVLTGRLIVLTALIVDSYLKQGRLSG